MKEQSNKIGVFAFGEALTNILQNIKNNIDHPSITLCQVDSDGVVSSNVYDVVFDMIVLIVDCEESSAVLMANEIAKRACDCGTYTIACKANNQDSNTAIFSNAYVNGLGNQVEFLQNFVVHLNIVMRSDSVFAMDADCLKALRGEVFFGPLLSLDYLNELKANQSIDVLLVQVASPYSVSMADLVMQGEMAEALIEYDTNVIVNAAENTNWCKKPITHIIAATNYCSNHSLQAKACLYPVKINK